MTSIEALRASIKKYETQSHIIQATLPFGIDELDQRLPGGGMQLGAFHEVAGGGDGATHSAAAALFIAGILARTDGQVLWCVKHRDLFAPALAQVGLAMERVVFAETSDDKTLLACFEEGLRSPGIAGVVGEVNKLPSVASRRLQLAAETSGAIGFALWRWRKGEIQKETNTVARTRWRITAIPALPLPVAGIPRGRWQVELLRCQGGEPLTLTVEACNETGNLAISPDLANRPMETQVRQRRAVH